MKSLIKNDFIRLTLVNILSNLMVPLASLVDLAFLGYLDEIHNLAGVSLATVLFNYIYWTFGFLRMGTTGTTAQARGSENHQEVKQICLRNCLIALVIGTIILIFQYPLREIGFSLLSATPEVKASGISYYQSLIWGAPATLLNFVLIGWFLGLEQGGKVLLLSVVNKGTNIILDYIFIVRWGWESSGAGSATAISQYITLVVGIICIFNLISLREIPQLIKDIWQPQVIRETFILNRDILIRTFALISTFAVFTNLSSYINTLVLATNTLLLQVVTLAAYFIDGLAFATESLAGKSYGEGNQEQLKILVKLSGIISVSIGLIFALVFCLFPTYLFGLLTNHTEIIHNINSYVFWLIPVLGFGGMAYMLDGYFLGLTQGSLLRNSTLIASLVGFLPFAMVGWLLKSNHILWLALAMFMAARAITLGKAIPNIIVEQFSPSIELIKDNNEKNLVLGSRRVGE
ncbi:MULTISPECIES: guanitoxin biosynthesis MATE family efflux transporter GntT [Okeania]|uniref:MATE family efflux transporter n=1 Tax=Okeania hirsuta TaxID=1458930 RepID=A0A3N6PC74_9CYAN|nr:MULTISPECIES: guanitoxin biosynthesis MATE family efflux transporter GntT [Okeania]NES74415.1 MATE family efflux transporter [Okeania sp. SIO1H4]NES92113.1 MATE family efflux transporter [Okeania sp. SIO2B9]NET18182.1 MATE family efflux transporter [Okeania sp. SIO1H5]NET92376.1 MATE family efflux transporter [Okeania sp. SIO1H2]RQH42198.1 MATE family efflux transporter [Okeania hirsuta]